MTDVLPQDLAVLKPQVSGLNFPNPSGIWQAPRQQYFRYACQISERYESYNIQFRGFDSLLDHRVKRPTAQ